MASPLTWIIYTLKNPRTNEVRYVGWTSRTANRRMNQHIQDAVIRAKCHRTKWILSLLSVGIRPVMEVVESGSGEGWAEAERLWIASFRANGARLVNATEGGEGTLGYVMKPEDVARRSKAARDRGHKLSPERLKNLIEAARAFNRGRKWTNERRAASAQSRKGIPRTPEAIENMKAAAKLRDFRDVSPEARAKMSAARRLRVTTEETRAKMSAAHQGRKPSPEAIAKGVAARSGLKTSDEARANMSAAQVLRFAKATPEERAEKGRVLRAGKLDANGGAR